MEFASICVERAIDVVLGPTIRQVGYIIYYRENVSELNSLVEDLRLERERVEHGVGEAENNLRTIEGGVRVWLQKVNATRTEIEEFQNDEAHTKTGCSTGLLPYLRNRHRLGRKAKKMATAVKLLIEKSKFDGVSYEQNPTSMDAALSNAGYVEFGSRKDTTEKIMEKLEDSSVRMIGVYGPGGVGKSTLIKEIARKAKDKKLFNAVVTVEITNNPNLQKNQEEIAYQLGLRLEGESENVRADRLRRRLKKETESTLVILDDLWDRIDLNNIGIPFDDDNDDDLSHMTIKDIKDPNFKMVKRGKSLGEIRIPFDDDNSDALNHGTIKDIKDPNFKMVKKGKSLGDYKGCKILLTSRDRKVLSDKMDAKSIFYVRELNDDDALMLFNKVAGIPHEMSKHKDIVKKYCAGLPMAIVAAGIALSRTKGESEWEATLENFKKEELMGVLKSMEISIKMSYDHLESEELKSIFLLCAQMGHQQLIMDLVKYSFGLGILEGVYTLREARDRIYTSLQKLKDLSLLLDGSSIYRFNMHDMVRDAALSIAHKELNVFALRNGKLDDWPDRDELERCTAISIRSSDIIDDLPKVINCPQLKFFQIDSDDPSLKIPGNFFKRMEKLRVLILTGFHLPRLPSSIKCLLNLRMLCLERCILVDNLSIIGELKKLRILSFSGSQIKNLPAALGCLDKLQLFDISDCSIMNVVPLNFISRLTCLEELYIRKSLIKTGVDGETDPSQISFLSQLKHLHQLRVVDFCVPSAAVLPRDLFFDRLNDYKIVIGDFKMLSVGDFRMPSKYEALRSLALQLTDGTDIHSQNGIKLLFKRVENLLLGELNGVQNVFDELNLDGFPDLKHLSIINNFGIEYIIDSMELSHPQNAFPNLESLCLYKLRNIKMICYTPVTGASFTKLKTIKVKMCTQLKNLFSFYVVKVLASLEIIDVSECDSLKEIVVNEGKANSDKVGLHKLRSLTLQSLPSFTSLYTNVEMPSVEGQTTSRDHIEITNAEDEHTVVVRPSLFDELVEIPNLESLKLSSINSHKIWSDQPLSSSCFQNLIKLTVKDCYNLRYLCSLSVASSLKKLKGLVISECRMMEKIFTTEANSVDKVCIFPKLEEIHLTELNMLTEIWQAEVGYGSFSSLISVQIEGCHKLDKIFPNHMTGWFGSLDSLKVVDCMSVEVIFEMKDSQQIDASRINTKLQLILLEELPRLKQVWDKDPGGILSFENLRSIEVNHCETLTYVLPASVAKDLERLERISVTDCNSVEEIVAWEDGLETPLEFPGVTHMELCFLSIKRFYMGGHIECPKLKHLAVYGDYHLRMIGRPYELEAFTTETTHEERQRGVFLAEKVISNLEYMEISSKEAEWLRGNYGKYRMPNLLVMNFLKELTLRSLNSTELLYWFLHRTPNLESLNLISSGFDLKELVPSGNNAPQGRLGTVLQLKALTLWSSAMKDLGFERDPVLQRLEHLALRGCGNLINLAPSSVSLTRLTYLEVNHCGGLINLMASSTAKSMVQLVSMKVFECEEVKEMVTNEGNEEDGVIEVVFSKLISIELVALRNLTSFCSYKNCEFKFPSLERLIVRGCPKMETFTEGHTTAPKLQYILAVEGEEEEKRYWEGDLNATIQKVFKDKVSFEYTEQLDLYHYHELLEQVWHHNDLVQQNIFHNLKSLTIRGGSNLVHAIPSHLLPCFENLEELKVSSCRAVQVIFNINDMRVTNALGTFRLKKLSLVHLPKLEHVWDKDPEGIFGLQVLQEMTVSHCDTLKNLFPASVAKDLTRLEELKVSDCTKLVEIFSKDETATEVATKEFVFPRLISLYLLRLPELKYFYPGLHKLEWPLLRALNADHCNLGILNCQEDHPEEQAFIEKTIQTLERILLFGMGDTKVRWNRGSRKLRFEGLPSFQEESDSDLYRFLVMLPNIERLLLSQGSFKEMFSAERPNADYTRVLLHLKELKLLDLDNLNTIGLEHPWLHPIPENLQAITVKSCGHLINLVPHMVSFSNLTYLYVYNCERLQYLLTSSTAKSLCRLKEMKIEWCESMQEIVSTEGDESHEAEKIIFEQLHTLYLKELWQLRCFYPGNFTLCFPSLEQVSLISCSWMKTFCPVNRIDPTKLSSGVTFIKDAIPRWEGDLNSTVRKRFEEEISEYAANVSDVSLRDDPLQEIWQGSLPVPDRCFSKLTDLILDGCQFLSEVLPSNLLPFLTTLLKLEVRNCSSVKTIFDVKCITEDRKMTTMEPAELPLPFSLEILKLEHLPNLENVWNEDPHGILRIQLLKEVHVDECKCLTSLFPASIAKDLVKLEKLHVKHCEELMVIVAEDNAERKGTNLEHSLIEPFLGNLETLEVITCVRLRSLAASPVCFSNLIYLSVVECHGLVYLFTSSTAKSLARLKKMEIGCCKSMQEIVSTEGDELHEDKKIIFEQLEALYLRDIQELKCFYSGNFTVAFPSLEQVLVINCHKMETFCPSIVNADRLRGVQFKDYSDAIPLEIDLNSTIRKAFLERLNPKSDDDEEEIDDDDDS